jgi:hypothetical protein
VKQNADENLAALFVPSYDNRHGHLLCGKYFLEKIVPEFMLAILLTANTPLNR